ncbi:MAG TPA: hypothetical protein VI685_03920, partial [Candidatus Angelobacter sp.]
GYSGSTLLFILRPAALISSCMDVWNALAWDIRNNEHNNSASNSFIRGARPPDICGGILFS